MATNTRLATGVHVLVMLAGDASATMTSATLAAKLDTNPVVIRRVLSLLGKAGLINSRKGPTGGSRMAKPATAISLADVYSAVESNPLFYMPAVSTSGPRSVNLSLRKLFLKSKSCIHEQLAGVSLEQIVKSQPRRLKLKK